MFPLLLFPDIPDIFSCRLIMRTPWFLLLVGIPVKGAMYPHPTSLPNVPNVVEAL